MPTTQPATAAQKVKVHFLAVGSAPIMKKKKFVVDGAKPFMTVAAFLRSQLKLQPGDPLFLYCNSAFAPSPDQQLSMLHKTNGELVVHYSITGAFG